MFDSHGKVHSPSPYSGPTRRIRSLESDGRVSERQSSTADSEKFAERGLQKIRKRLAGNASAGQKRL
jgi:hypothetical protein